MQVLFVDGEDDIIIDEKQSAHRITKLVSTAGVQSTIELIMNIFHETGSH